MNIKSVSLALSGGGARGAYHLGAIHCLNEMNIEIKAICGTSIGALIGVSYASGVSPTDQLKIFKSKEFRSIFSFRLFGQSFFKIDANAKILNRLVLQKRLEDLKIPVSITAVDLNSGKNLYFQSGDAIALCMSSCALIPVFEPVKYQNMVLADGGIVNHMPLGTLKNNGLPILGINLHPIFDTDTKSTLWQNIKRTLYIMTFSQNRQSQEACDLLITSPKLSKYSIFSFKYLDELFDLGYNDAKNALNRLNNNCNFTLCVLKYLLSSKIGN